MIAFADMLTGAAEVAGMKVPMDTGDFDDEVYPHFAVFCTLQLNRPVCYHGEHWHNATVIAEVPEDKIRLMTLEDFINAGLSIQH